MAVDRKSAIAALAKELGAGTLHTLSEQIKPKVESTGIATLDAALGTGGFTRGSMVALYGGPSSGKSALAYTAIGNLMKRDETAMALVVDIERSADKDWMAMFGCDPDRVMVMTCETIEEYVNKTLACIKSNSFDYIVVDSLGAVARSVDVFGKDGDGGDVGVQQVGGSSRVITSMVNLMNSALSAIDKEKYSGHEVVEPVILFINQVRDVIGSRFPMQGMPGGNAFKHMCSVIVKVQASGAAADRMMGTVGGNKRQVGQRVMCTVEKNKFAPPRRQGGYLFCYEPCDEYGFGIDSADALVSLAVERGVVTGRGAWLYHGEDKYNGRQALCSAVRGDEKLYEGLYRETMETFAREAFDAR